MRWTHRKGRHILIWLQNLWGEAELMNESRGSSIYGIFPDGLYLEAAGNLTCFHCCFPSFLSLGPIDPEILWKSKSTGLFTLQMSHRKASCPLPSLVERLVLQAPEAPQKRQMSSPHEKVHNNLCKTAPLDKHNVAIYTPLAISCRSCSLCRLEGRVRP